MGETTKRFVAGTLPGWFNVIIMALCAFLLTDLHSTLKDLVKVSNQHEVDIAVLKQESKTFEAGIAALVQELKNLNTTILMRPVATKP